MLPARASKTKPSRRKVRPTHSLFTAKWHQIRFNWEKQADFVYVHDLAVYGDRPANDTPQPTQDTRLDVSFSICKPRSILNGQFANNLMPIEAQLMLRRGCRLYISN